MEQLICYQPKMIYCGNEHKLQSKCEIFLPWLRNQPTKAELNWIIEGLATLSAFESWIPKGKSTCNRTNWKGMLFCVLVYCRWSLLCLGTNSTWTCCSACVNASLAWVDDTNPICTSCKEWYPTRHRPQGVNVWPSSQVPLTEGLCCFSSRVENITSGLVLCEGSPQVKMCLALILCMFCLSGSTGPVLSVQFCRFGSGPRSSPVGAGLLPQVWVCFYRSGSCSVGSVVVV